MNRIFKIQFIFLSLFLFSSVGNANVWRSTKKRTCFSDFISPLGGPGVFDSDTETGHISYFLYNKGPLNSKKPDSLYTFEIYKIDTTDKIDKFVGEPMIALQLPATSLLFNFGYPLVGLLIGGFQKDDSLECAEGKGSVIMISFKKPDKNNLPSIAKKTGRFGMLGNRLAGGVVDLDTGKLLYPNLEKGEFKEIATINNQVVPVMFDHPDMILYLWNSQPSRDLRTYNIALKPPKPLNKLNLKPDEKLYKNLNRFAVVKLDKTANSLKIISDINWTKTRDNNEQSITLPKEYLVDDAVLNINFEKNLAVVYGSTKNAQMRWRRIFLFDLSKGIKLADFIAKDNLYITFAAIDPPGKFVLVETKAKNSMSTAKLKIYDIMATKWLDLELKEP